MKSIKLFFTFLLVGLFFIAKASFALPFSVTPVFLPNTVIAGEETFAYYTVTNTTTKAAPGSFVKFLPPNVKQSINAFNTNICSATFDLAPGGSCTLKLVIAGPVDAGDPSPQHHLFVCRQGGKTCAGTNAPLNVAPITLVSIAVEPAVATIPNGTKQKFIAIGTFSNGSSRKINLVTWTSSATAVAQINNLGVASGIGLGNTEIRARAGSIVSPAAILGVTAAILTSLSVTPDDAAIHAGTTQQYTAIGTYSDNSTHDISQSVIWSSSNDAVATIISGIQGGLASGLTTGAANITATDSVTTLFDTVPLTVTAPTLDSITIIPGASTISIGEKLQYTAIGNYSDSTTQDITASVTWSSSNTAVATISSIIDAGVALGLEVGTTSIRATSISGGIVSNLVPLTVEAVASLPVYAGLSNGTVCLSINNGQTWPNSACGAVTGALSINALTASNNNRVYAGTTATGGVIGTVCNTTVGNVSFICAPALTNKVNALAAQNNSVYAGLGDGSVCVSTDNGTTFPLCVVLAGPVRAIAFDDGHVYAGSDQNVCISEDNGVTFPTCIDVNAANKVFALATETGYVYAGTEGTLFTDGFVCVSTDNGQTWATNPCVNLFHGIVTALAVNTEDQIVYAATADGNVCASYNHGSSWSCVPTIVPAVLSLALDPGNIYAGATTNEVCVSTDAGTSWPANLCAPVGLQTGAFVRALTVGFSQ